MMFTENEKIHLLHQGQLAISFHFKSRRTVVCLAENLVVIALVVTAHSAERAATFLGSAAVSVYNSSETYAGQFKPVMKTCSENTEFLLKPVGVHLIS